MQLRKPEQFKFDPGRVLTPEERVAVEKAVTPIHQIQSRTCKRTDTNEKWRLGRK